MTYRPLVAVPGTGVMGVVYLLHFNKPYKHAQHYWGWASHLEARLEHHANGSGGRLPGVVAAAGIEWSLAMVIPGDRNTERQMKNRGGATRLCPICKEEKAMAPQYTMNKSQFETFLVANDSITAEFGTARTTALLEINPGQWINLGCGSALYNMEDQCYHVRTLRPVQESVPTSSSS
jgi:hypothetical protein